MNTDIDLFGKSDTEEEKLDNLLNDLTELSENCAIVRLQKEKHV